MALWRQAVAVLQQMRLISERLELVFPSPFYSTKPLSENTFNSAMARMGYKFVPANQKVSLCYNAICFGTIFVKTVECGS